MYTQGDGGQNTPLDGRLPPPPKKKKSARHPSFLLFSGLAAVGDVKRVFCTHPQKINLTLGVSMTINMGLAWQKKVFYLDAVRGRFHPADSALDLGTN